MIKRFIILLILILNICPVYSQEEESEGEFDEKEAGIQYELSGEFLSTTRMFIEKSIKNKLEYSGEELYLFFNAGSDIVKLYTQFYFEYLNTARNPSDEEQVDLHIKELYANILLDSIDLRIGRQRIGWGSADLFSPMDVFSPRDYEYLYIKSLQKRNSDKLAVDGLNLLYQKDPINITFCVIPQYPYNIYASTDSFWSLYPDVLTMNDQPVAPDYQHAWGLRVSTSVRNGDYALSYYDGLDNETLFNIDYTLFTITPYYYRIKKTGFDFAQVMEDLNFRGEAVYTHNKKMEVSGLKKKTDLATYTLGVDYELFTDFILLVEGTQSFIVKNRSQFKDKQNNESFLGRIKYSFYDGTIHLENSGIYQFDYDVYLHYASVEYDFQNGFIIKLGGLFADERKKNDFSPVIKNDLAYLQFLYNF